jgi:hypothetical protein
MISKVICGLSKADEDQSFYCGVSGFVPKVTTFSCRRRGLTIFCFEVSCMPARHCEVHFKHIRELWTHLQWTERRIPFVIKLLFPFPHLFWACLILNSRKLSSCWRDSPQCCPPHVIQRTPCIRLVMSVRGHSTNSVNVTFWPLLFTWYC